MYLKYIPETTERGVEIFGPIHGVVFVLYVLMCFVAWWAFSWPFKVLVIGLLASIPPLTTLIFDYFAERRGLMSENRPSSSLAN